MNPGRRLFWVRHAPTYQKVMTGWRDVEADLSDMLVLKRLNDWLPSDATIVSSDLIRACQTADAIAGSRRRLPPEPGIREFNFGRWDGRSFDEIAKTDPELSRDFWENPGTITAPGGESWDDLVARVSQTISHLFARTDGDLIAVAHFGTILCHTASVTSQPAFEALAQPIDPLSVTELHFETNWSVKRVNFHPWRAPLT